MLPLSTDQASCRHEFLICIEVARREIQGETETERKKKGLGQADRQRERDIERQRSSNPMRLDPRLVVYPADLLRYGIVWMAGTIR